MELTLSPSQTSHLTLCLGEGGKEISFQSKKSLQVEHFRLKSSFVVDAVFLVVPNVVVVALFIFTDSMIYNCGQYMFIWGS